MLVHIPHHHKIVAYLLALMVWVAPNFRAISSLPLLMSTVVILKKIRNSFSKSMSLISHTFVAPASLHAMIVEMPTVPRPQIAQTAHSLTLKYFKFPFF